MISASSILGEIASAIRAAPGADVHAGARRGARIGVLFGVAAIGLPALGLGIADGPDAIAGVLSTLATDAAMIALTALFVGYMTMVGALVRRRHR